MQLTSVPMILKEIDIEQECLESLEEEMFKDTEQTGVSKKLRGDWMQGITQGVGIPCLVCIQVGMGRKEQGVSLNER